MTANIRVAAGSLLVVGLAGTELSGLERAWLRLVRPSGIILFKRNIFDAAQTRGLLAQATELCAQHALRCVDVEGGTVDRLRDALAAVPSAQAVMTAAKHSGNSHILQEHGELIARGVKAFGFNATLAPVLDLSLPDSANVMGSRAVSASPSEVTEFAAGFLSGLKAQGVAGCGKHFPGLGGGTLDSHLETPKIGRTTRQMNSKDLVPFRALRHQLPMVMVNHAAYPNTPGRSRPASVSAYWITTVLRRQIGYRGLIFSDDLEMGGILKFMPIEEAVVAAVRAGMDLMEICHSPELILRAYEALVREGEQSPTFARLITARARESSLKRKELFPERESRALSAREFEALRKRTLKFGERISLAQKAGPA